MSTIPGMDYSHYSQRFHDGSDKHFEEVARLDYESLARYLPAKDGKILDLGCGAGFALGGLRANNYSNIIGIDSDVAQVEAAKSRGLNVDLVQSEQTIEYIRRTAPYDFIYCLDVLEHIPTALLMRLLEEIKASLAAGSSFVCRVPNCDSVIASRYRYNDWTHQTQFGDASLDFVLFNAGFTNIRIFETPDPLPTNKAAFRWVLRRITRGFRRVELVSELRWSEAVRIPLTPNIWAVADV
jgi:SAM-dependent methyltransferase